MKFFGELGELKAYVSEIGLVGEWQDKGNHQSFRARTGEVVNFYSTGTLVAQGKNQDAVKAHLSALCDGEALAPVAEVVKEQAAHIFIVHGHDTPARNDLELVLRRLGLDPFILQNQGGGGLTLVEALEKSIYEQSAFGIIMMTPDDYGYPKDKSDADRRARARQNVILEMGMVMASLGRERMAILKKGNLEIPSDAEGIIRLEFNERVQEVVPALVQRLEEAGIVIDHSRIAAASR